MYHINLGLLYDNPEILRAELFGHHISYDRNRSATWDNGKFAGFLWDLTLSKTVVSREAYTVDLFATVHNLFNGSQYARVDFANAPRWGKIGARVHYY